MSQFRGPQHKGAMRERRVRKRAEAELRNSKGQKILAEEERKSFVAEGQKDMTQLAFQKEVDKARQKARQRPRQRTTAKTRRREEQR